MVVGETGAVGVLVRQNVVLITKKVSEYVMTPNGKVEGTTANVIPHIQRRQIHLVSSRKKEPELSPRNGETGVVGQPALQNAVFIIKQVPEYATNNRQSAKSQHVLQQIHHPPFRQKKETENTKSNGQVGSNGENAL